MKPPSSGLTNASEAPPLNVLVVDDDPAALRLAAKIVSSAGHRVSLAENGRQALDAILQDPPDLVLCDWDMPKLDGLALCREVRRHELPRYVYVILLTGKSSADEIVEGLAAGADDFVTKPICRAVLLARLEAGSRVLRMERRLRTVSQYDPLTGVLNRRAFHQRVVQEWERATRYGGPLACAMIDLDFFKRINDAHGHAGGDATLTAVASLLEDQCRPSDVLCRFGGEEFCVLLAETNEAGAAQWAERVRTIVAETAIPVDDAMLRVTASLGVAERLSDMASPEDLIELADQALAVAKQSGRNRVVRFSSLDEPMLDPHDKQSAVGPLDGVLARDVMSVALLCPGQDDTVRNVADLFLQLRLNSAPVVDETGTVAGIVAEADLLNQTALGKGWEATMRDVMRTDVVCYDEDTPVEQVYQFLSRVSVPRIVVVDQGRPTGVISRATLLRWIRNWVATHEEAGSGDPWTCPDRDRNRRKTAIIKTAEVAEARVADLRRRIAGEDHDFVPCVVGEATRLQSLVNDLLGHCRTSPVA